MNSHSLSLDFLVVVDDCCLESLMNFLSREEHKTDGLWKTIKCLFLGVFVE